MTPHQIEAYVDAAAAALQLPLAPEHRPGVLQYFALAAGLADVLMAYPLGRDDEPAEVFTPISPASSSPGSVSSAAGIAS
ncbi:hypothetical protein BH11PSE8_BH11PSE8_27400 [soil metagenome]